MNYFSFIFQDWNINQKNTKGRIVTLFFRIANYCKNNRVARLAFAPYLIFYKITFEWFFGIELPYKTSVGKNLTIFHLPAIIINQNTIIGDNCILRHSTTIGNKENSGRSPIIGCNVNIGANVCIIGDIIIGDNVIIGAGSVVTKSVPQNSVVVGNPAKIIKQLKNFTPNLKIVDENTDF